MSIGSRLRRTSVADWPFPFVMTADIPWVNLWWATTHANFTPPADGAAVTAFADVKAALSLTAAGTSPTYRASVAGLNNKPALEFTAAGQLAIAGTPAANAQPNTVVAIFQMTNIQTGAHASMTDSESGQRQAIYKHSGGDFRGYAGTLGATSGITADLNKHLAIYEANGASSSIQIDGTVGTGSWGTNNLRGFLIGRGPGSVQPFLGFIPLAGWIDGVLTTTQKNNLRAWAQGYYGTP